MTHTRRYDERDHDAVMALADRLTAGRQPWRDAERWLATVRGWVAEAILTADLPTHAVFVAVSDSDSDVAGFVSVSTRTHFTGDVDAYVGELVVARAHERSGVGRQLLGAAETWARAQGLARITLDTGAANAAARALYDAEGYAVEDVRVTKSLDA